jgi:hypothetical protein
MRSLLPVAVLSTILFTSMTPAFAGEGCEKSSGCKKAKNECSKAECEKAKANKKAEAAKDEAATKKEASGETKEEAGK